jgi:hypothetical protein
VLLGATALFHSRSRHKLVCNSIRIRGNAQAHAHAGDPELTVDCLASRQADRDPQSTTRKSRAEPRLRCEAASAVAAWHDTKPGPDEVQRRNGRGDVRRRNGHHGEQLVREQRDCHYTVQQRQLHAREMQWSARGRPCARAAGGINAVQQRQLHTNDNVIGGATGYNAALAAREHRLSAEQPCCVVVMHA